MYSFVKTFQGDVLILNIFMTIFNDVFELRISHFDDDDSNFYDYFIV